jgi:SAM-dependent methyltransferase
MTDWEGRADELAARELAADRPTGWFEPLWSGGAAGDHDMPWSRTDPHPFLADWLRQRRIDPGLQVVVVGCGLGADAEHLAGLGAAVTGFDVSPTAIRMDGERDSDVQYAVADLFALPDDWRASFDLVVEIYTVQALPRRVRTAAIAAVRSLVAPGGTLFAVQRIRRDDEPDTAPPPWPLTRAEMEQLAGGWTVDELDTPTISGSTQWRLVARAV